MKDKIDNKGKRYWLRGGLIGLVVGIIWAIIGMVGVINCHWNPVEGSVVPSGICSNPIIEILFGIPIILGMLIVMVLLWALFGSMEAVRDNILPILSGIITLALFCILGIIIGYIYGKIKNRGNVK